MADMTSDTLAAGLGFDADAVIVGAGPAGCSAALTLAAEGASVLVAEQGEPGKDKPCGDAYVPAAVDLAKQLGVAIDTFVRCGREFAGFDLLQNGKPVWRSDLCGATGWISRRAVVDQALRDLVAKCCRVIYGMRVTEVVAAPHGVALIANAHGERRVLLTRAVILSGGSGCGLARTLGLDGASVLTAALSMSVEPKEMPEYPLFLYQSDSPGGYAWIFPVDGEHANAGVCALTPAACRGLKQRAVDFTAQLGTAADQSLGGAEALWSGRGRVWHHPHGVLCCGDAAGLVDPLWGEGITAAFESGRTAGEAIAAHLRGNPKALPDYSGWVSSHFAARYGATPERRSLAVLSGISSEPC
jgi:flavin-dependent dehydrogenase